MAYEDKDQRRDVRHTVRLKKEDSELIAVMANRLGMQKATLIAQMALVAVEAELQRLGVQAGDAPAQRAACH